MTSPPRHRDTYVSDLKYSAIRLAAAAMGAFNGSVRLTRCCFAAVPFVLLAQQGYCHYHSLYQITAAAHSNIACSLVITG